MPRLSVNLSEAQSREALPEGMYECEVYAISEPKDGPNSRYVEAVFAVNEGEFIGRKFYRNCPITGKGAGIFADFWEKATGEELEIGVDGDFDVDTDDAVGQPVVVVNKPKEYPVGSGEFQNEVTKLLRAGDG